MEIGSNLKSLNEFRFYKRNLPHWEDPGSIYFITSNTFNKLILSEVAKDIIFASIKFHADKKYKLYSCVVMDTHIHVIFQPLKDANENYFSIAQIIHSIKSYSAYRIQRLLSINGRVWQAENYDRIIRDDQDYIEKMEYIIFNPVKSGLVENPDNYRWLFYVGSS